jgi:hypothetical protein
MSVLADRTYDYILQLLGFDRLAYPDHPVIEALKDMSYTSYPSLFQLRQDDVEALTYMDYDVYPPVRRHLPDKTIDTSGISDLLSVYPPVPYELMGLDVHHY